MAARKAIKIVAAAPEHICKECRYAHYKRAEGLFCKLNPPQYVYDYQSGASELKNPEVNPQDWCGQFAPQLSS
jgi:hypothetical protein